MLRCVAGGMTEGQNAVNEQCQLAELLHDLTAAEEYAYGRADWDVTAAEEIVSIGTQLLRYCNLNVIMYTTILCTNTCN